MRIEIDKEDQKELADLKIQDFENAYNYYGIEYEFNDGKIKTIII